MTYTTEYFKASEIIWYYKSCLVTQKNNSHNIVENSQKYENKVIALRDWSCNILQSCSNTKIKSLRKRLKL